MRIQKYSLLASIFLLVVAVLLANANVGVASSNDVTLSSEKPKQGQTLEVRISASDNAEAPPTVHFNNREYKTFPLDQTSSADATIYRALIGVPADLKPGKYAVRIGEVERTISVLPGGFGVQRIRLPRSKDNFISSPGEEEAVSQAKSTVTPEQRWQGKFRPPSKARVTSVFGLRRMVNGKLLTDYFHSGIDYAGGLGSPVYATQKGRVIIAKTGWRLHGNTIALDHGQGVVSFYIHLNKILVKSGQVVEAGQEIGKIGATGRASGPHLHFSLYVNNAATNPVDWYAKAY